LLDTDLKIILLNSIKIIIGRSSGSLEIFKMFCNIAHRANFLHNYFDEPTKLFSDLYSAKFLDILAKSFFP